MEAYIEPAFAEHNIPIFFSCSDQFVPHAAAAIQSLLAHASDAHNYDVMILHTGVSENSQRLVQLIVADVPNFSVRFWDVKHLFQSKVFGVHHYFSVEVFYRLMIPWLLNCPKAIYLDSDLVVLRDIADLFAVDIGDNLLGAVTDGALLIEYYSDAEVKKYYDMLCPDSILTYFNSGVLVFNIPAFRAAFTAEELLDFAQKQTYRYVDQDVLNAKCGQRTYQLNMVWNVLTDFNGIRIHNITRFAPPDICQAYLESRENPYIIHYAGPEKPWCNPQSDYAEAYWKYARQTPFYEMTLYRIMYGIVYSIIPANPTDHTAPAADNRSAVRKLADRVLPKGSRRRNLAKKILPKDSWLWNFLKKIYWKVWKK